MPECAEAAKTATEEQMAANIEAFEEMRAQRGAAASQALRARVFTAEHAEAVMSALQLVPSEVRPLLCLGWLANPAVSDAAFWSTLHRAWDTFDAIPHADYGREMRRRRAGWSPKYMRPDDAAYVLLPYTIDVFRGQDRRKTSGLSWTICSATAAGFARGHRGLYTINLACCRRGSERPRLRAF